jgi:TIGR03009 family protein
MRRAGLTLSALLAAAPAGLTQAPPAGTPPAGGTVPMNLVPVPAQPPAPVAAVNPAALPAALVQHLNAWEAKHKQVQNLYADCEMVKKDLTFRKDKAYTGKVMCMKPNLAWMKIEAKGNPADYEAYICDGKSVFHYDAGKKQVNEHPIPRANPNSVGDNLLIEFMSGSMSAADVIRRFDLTLEKEEEYYVHIRVKPRLPKDLQEFESLLLVLYGPKTAHLKRDYLPAVVVLRGNNGQNEEQWTFSNPIANAGNLTREHFQFVQPPKGWDVKPPAAGLPPAGDPKVARPAGPGK